MRYLILGVCVFAAACAGEAPGAPTSASSTVSGASATDAERGSALPFGGTLQSTERVESGDATSEVRHLDGTGNATHLGRFSLSVDFTVTPSTGNAVGTATWTAANGDPIFATVTGHGDIVVFPTVVIGESHSITGGTGRFADASGTIRMIGPGATSLERLPGHSPARSIWVARREPPPTKGVAIPA